MVSIIKNLTEVNFTKMKNKQNKYIVIHYVGAVSSAKTNSQYFKLVNRNASANYFVDETSIYQVVEDENKAWHCGGRLQGLKGHKYYLKCTNSNSIGIEMCLDKPNHIADKTLDNVADLVQMLMKKYNIPESNVIRHYDVTGKICPAMYIDENKWINLKKKLVDITSSDKKNTVNIHISNKPLNTWVKRLQKEIGAVVDGIVGKETLGKCPVIKKGNKGDIAKLLQEKLTGIGYDTKGVDGIMGSNSIAAIKKFQKKNKLTVDGIFGYNSWKKLLGL